jgi:hypothetical protein
MTKQSFVESLPIRFAEQNREQCGRVGDNLHGSYLGAPISSYMSSSSKS